MDRYLPATRIFAVHFSEGFTATGYGTCQLPVLAVTVARRLL